MADEYQNAVKKLSDYIGDTVNFAKGELPDVAAQMVTYGGAVEHMWFIFFMVIAALSLILLFACAIGESDSDEKGATIFSFCVFVIFSGLTMSSYAQLMKIEKAPKLYVIEKMAEKVKDAQCSKN